MAQTRGLICWVAESRVPQISPKWEMPVGQYEGLTKLDTARGCGPGPSNSLSFRGMGRDQAPHDRDN
jgi:hypothetical protein